MASLTGREVKRRCPGLLVILVLAVAGPWLHGCGLERDLTERYQQANLPWGYVLKMGSAQDITRWTLEQTEIEKVSDGLRGLRTVISLRGPGQRKDAVDGYLQVHQKLLDGWPGLEEVEPVPEKLGVWTREDLIMVSRMLSDGPHRDRKELPEARELLERLKKIDPGAVEAEPKRGRSLFRRHDEEKDG